jgi:formylglycine-generating enzyme required for sulfatase activity
VTRAFHVFLRQAAQLNKSDVVLISFAGHGVQQQIAVGEGEDRRLVETPFLCVVDTLLSDTNTMINLNGILEELKIKSGSSNNLILIDACRNNPKQAARSLDGSTVKELPTKLSILFSSSSGQPSYESRELRQGIFTHVLLEGLRGEAKNSRGEVNWAKLASHVLVEVPIRANALGPESPQQPNFVGNLIQSPILATVSNTTPSTIPSAPGGAPSRSNSPSRLAGLSAPFSAEVAKRGQKDWANHLGVAVTDKNSIGLELILIPPGEFTMGSEDSDSDADVDEKPAHRVTLTQPFLMASTEVTQGQWKSVMGTEPWQGNDYVRVGADYPATFVSWADAVEFCQRLGQQEGRQYRLPTEAEWEYACRGGSRTQYSFGDNRADLDGYGWFSANARDNYERYAHRVGQKRPNPFGLYDMHGNVWEWCSDWYGGYASGSQTNPTGSESGELRVDRGGSWNYEPRRCRSAVRDGDSPTGRDDLGFRPVSVLVE